MPFKLFNEPIVPVNPAGLTTGELQHYLNVGRNTVSPVLLRLGISRVHGIVPEAILWRQLFGIVPEDEEAQMALREPLVDINWVSQATGTPMSTLRDHLRTDRLQYNPGVQLGERTRTAPPRLRRWMPCIIRSQMLASQLPNFAKTPPFPLPVSEDFPTMATAAEEAAEQHSRDVFSLLWTIEKQPAQ